MAISPKIYLNFAMQYHWRTNSPNLVLAKITCSTVLYNISDNNFKCTSYPQSWQFFLRPRHDLDLIKYNSFWWSINLYTEKKCCLLVGGVETASSRLKTPIWWSVRLTPSIHPYAVSPDLLNLWLDSMFISPLEVSWEIRWCTTATQPVELLSRKVQLTQIPVEVGWSWYSKKDCTSSPNYNIPHS